MDHLPRRSLFAALAGVTAGGLVSARSAQAADVEFVVRRPSSDADNAIAPTAGSVLPLSINAHANQSSDLTLWAVVSGRRAVAVTHRGAIERRPAEADVAAPFTWEVSAVEFEGVQNPVSYFGYNAGFGGTRVVDEEPSARYVVEADYHDGSKRTVEMYAEIVTAGGPLTVRPFFWQVVRDSNDSRTAMTRATLAGDPLQVETPEGLPLAAFERNRTILTASDPDHDTGLVMRAGAGRSAYLRLGAGDTDDALSFHTLGVRHIGRVAVDGRPVLHLFSTPLGAPGAAISVGAVDNQAAGVFAVGESNRTVKALVARGRTNQTADLQEWQDADGTALAGVTPGGRFRWTTGNEVAVAQAGVDPVRRPEKYLQVVDSTGRTLLIPAYRAPGSNR